MILATRLLSASVLALAALLQPAVAADYVIRLSHGMPEALEFRQHAWALVFKETVEARSAGKIEVRILGNNSAGNERQQLERVQNGINQMLLVSEITQPFFFKPALVLGIPFLFSSSEEAFAVFDVLSATATTKNSARRAASASSITSRAASAASSTASARSRRRRTSQA